MAFQNDSIFWVEVEKIVPNPFQPRREFDPARLEELAESIRMYGVLQPLTVTRREIQGDNGAFYTEYELIAGERRLRASKLAGVSLVPVIIREGEQNEQEKLELAIIENLQREDLNAVDRALAFKQLADSFNLSQTQVAKKVGRSREYVANSIRLLALPDYMLDALRSGDMAEGHARTLLMLNDRPEEQDTVFREILLKKLSVREVERIARKIATDRVRRKDNIDPELIELEKRFTETLGTRVQIQKTEFGGKLTIDYFSSDDLAYMLERMKQDGVITSGARTPFSPDVQLITDNPDRNELEELEAATPLSAMIAQLQEVDSEHADEIDSAMGSKEYDNEMDSETEAAQQFFTPRYAQAEVPTEPEQRFHPPYTNQTESADHQDARNQYEQDNSPEIVRADEINTPENEEVVRLPQVVHVARDYTTAVYVADTQHPQQPKQVQTATTEEVVQLPDDSDLYSIRNFSV